MHRFCDRETYELSDSGPFQTAVPKEKNKHILKFIVLSI
jgi:hypothetical protein